MKLSKKLLNKLILVRFWDHTNSKELVLTKVCGWVTNVDIENITVCVWDLETKDKDLKEQNQDLYSIIKSSITDLKILNEDECNSCINYKY